MSSGLLDFDTSHRRQNSCRDSGIEELDYDTTPPADAPTVMQQQQSSRPQLVIDFHEPPSKYPESDSHKHQLPNSLSSDADPPTDPNDTTNGGRRVHRPNWARSPSLTLQNDNNNNTAAKNRRPNLLRSVSMRSSFTIGRRSTAPTEHNNFFNRGGEDEHPMSATLEGGRNTDNKDRRNTDTTNKKKKKKGYIIRRWSHSDDDRPKNIVKRDIADASELSHYQEVFQQMKLQNPALSLGALQQKTMKRMSELKVEKEEMERMNLQRLKELESSAGRHGHHGSNSNGGNVGRMTLLGSLFHHRPRAGSDLSDRNSSGLGSDHSDHDNHNNSNTSNNHIHQGTTLPKAPYNVDDSFRSNNSVDSSHRGVLSRATILISQSLSSNNNNQESTTAAGEGSYPSLRRSTIDTNPSTEADGSNDGSGVGVGGVPLILRTSLILMGEDQNGNLAPRKSVGDFTAMMAGWDDQDSDEDDDDAMFEIDRSKSSGLFISGDEESKASGLYRSKGDENAAFLDEVERDLSNRGEDDNHVKLEILETHLQQLDASHRSRPHCGEMSSNTFHSLMSVSEISNHTTVTEGSYTDCSGSLIVGFGKQRVEKEDESRGFAADFSAWENI